MLKNINILLIAFYLLTLSASVYAGGFHTGSSHFAVKHNAFSRHKSKYTSQSFAKHRLKFDRKWHHKAKNKNKIIFPHYAYYPHYASYGIKEDNYVEINIINDKKGEQIEPTVNKDKSFTPPRIVNWEDIEAQKPTESLKSSNEPENVILIYGTKVIEKTISSD